MRTCNYDEGLRGLFRISPLNLTSNLCDTPLRHFCDIDIMVSFIPIERADISNCFGLDEKHDDDGSPLAYASSLDRNNESMSKNILYPFPERSGRWKIGRSGFSFLVFTCMPSLCDGILRQTRESPPDVACSARFAPQPSSPPSNGKEIPREFSLYGDWTS